MSDVARLVALIEYGGIYLDTDVEIIKPIDELLNYDAVMGFETDELLYTGVMACKKENEIFKKILQEYENIHFLRSDGSMDQTANVSKITHIFLQSGLKQNNTFKKVNGVIILHRDYLSLKNMEQIRLILLIIQYLYIPLVNHGIIKRTNMS